MARNSYEARAGIFGLAFAARASAVPCCALIARVSAALPFSQVRPLRDDEDRPDELVEDKLTLTRSGEESVSFLAAGTQPLGSGAPPTRRTQLFYIVPKDAPDALKDSLNAFIAIASRQLGGKPDNLHVVELSHGEAYLFPWLRFVWHGWSPKAPTPTLTVPKLAMEWWTTKRGGDAVTTPAPGDIWGPAIDSFPNLLVQRDKPEEHGPTAFAPADDERKHFEEWLFKVLERRKLLTAAAPAAAKPAAAHNGETSTPARTTRNANRQPASATPPRA